MDSSRHVVVIGGGIFGVSAALALAEHGFGNVTLLDRDHVGQAATALAAGVVSVQTWNDADAQLILETRQRIEDLAAWARDADLPAAGTVWHPCGALTVAAPARRALMTEIRDRIRRVGDPAELFDAAEAARRFPTFQFGPGEVVLATERDGFVESTDLTDLARRRAQALGVRVRERVRATGLRVDDGSVRGVDVDAGDPLDADAVVVAAGAWTRSLVETVGYRLPAVPYRTQLAVVDLAGADASPVLHDTVLGFYGRHESAGRLLAGDGTVLREFDPDAHVASADADFIESVASRVLERYRGAREARFRNAWAGLCVGTPDRRPLAGPVPSVEGLWALTGDNGFGVMRGLALGALVATGMAGGRDDRAAGVDPTRFGFPPPASFPLAEGFSFPD